jgi:hypothetical protein
VVKEEREIVIIEEVNGQWAAQQANLSLTSKSSSPHKGSMAVGGLSTQMGGMRSSGHSSSPSKLASKTAQGGGVFSSAAVPDSALLEKEKQALQRIKQKQ